MTMHPTDDTLHDWADGTIDPDARPAVERHLAACDACRARVERLRALLAVAASAPRAIEPGDDLWPAIRARIAPAGVRPLHPSAAGSPAAAPRWPITRRALQLVAAGLAIAALSSALTLRLAGRQTAPAAAVAARPAAPDPASPSSGTTPPRAAVAEQYARAADELAAAWRRTQVLDPASAAGLEQELRAIDHAIAESRRALAASPDDPLLAELLTAAYRRKVELLRRALELPAWT